MDKFFDTIFDASYKYHTFTYVSNQHLYLHTINTSAQSLMEPFKFILFLPTFVVVVKEMCLKPK